MTIIFFKMLRPLQWAKNLMIFFPSILSGVFLEPAFNFFVGFVSFVAFCLVSSALYIINDLRDIDRDVLHPAKRTRPLASGMISKKLAALSTLILGLSGVTLALIFVRDLLPFMLLYGVVTISYTFWLKSMPVVDLFCVSFGFVVRLLAGGAVFNVDISAWLFLSVLFLSLFFCSGKRLSEKNLLGSDANEHRSSLCGYPEGVLESVLLISASTSLGTYTMYTLTHPKLVYSVPLCTFGLFRYILRVKRGNSGDPTESLFKDIPLLCVSVCWALLVVWSIYL